MSVLDALQGLWKRDAIHYVFASIPPARQDPSVPEVTLTAEQHYFRVWISEMFLKDDRRLFREFVPVVHSSIRLQFGAHPAQELPYVAGPQNLGLPATVGKGVQLNHFLTNLLPFRGGTVGMAAALVAYKEKDFFKGFVNVLSDVSGLLNVGQLSTTLKVVDSAVNGIQDLLGGGDRDIHLLYFEGFGGATSGGGRSLTTGYTAVIKADAATFDQTKLWIKGSRLFYGDSLVKAKPLDGYDYMLLRVEAATERDDYLSFETFAKLLQDSIREGHRDRAAGDAMIRGVTVAVWDSPDLTVTDRIRVAKAIVEEYQRALGAPPPPPPSPSPAPPPPPTPAPPVDPVVVQALAKAIKAVNLTQPTRRLLGTPMKISFDHFLKELATVKRSD